MAMTGFTLAQQQRQQMSIAPQLRQSLDMLQKPVMELRQAIYNELQANPMLEEIDEPAERRESDEGNLADSQALVEAGQDFDPEIDGGEDPYILAHGKTLEEREDESQELDFDPQLDAVLREDDEMRDYALQGMENGEDLEDAAAKRQYFLDSVVAQKSLQEHLLEQLPASNVKKSERQLALAIIGAVNDDGYFAGSLEDIARENGSDEETAERVLAKLQSFDPPGVAARDLRECLLLQWAQVEDSPWEDEVRLLIDRYLDKLARHDDAFLCQALKVDRKGLAEVVRLLRTLDPKPGRAYTDSQTEYVEPEVDVVRGEDGRYIAVVDDEMLPRIHISRAYKNLLNNPSTSKTDKSYIRERLRAGLFLVESLRHRQETIRRIAQCIVDAQPGFWQKGIVGMRPLTMVEVAKKVEVHETTVSRTVANKYMRTPRGVFPMRFFFTTGSVKTADGESVSGKTVQNKIAELVRAENPHEPLSDETIAAKLKEMGFNCARRTVAKYRGILKIPSSAQRRRT